MRHSVVVASLKSVSGNVCSLQVLYILQLHQDYEAGTAHVSSVSEFLLTQPVLSFALLDAGRRRLVKAQEYDAEHAWSCTTGMCLSSFVYTPRPEHF